MYENIRIKMSDDSKLFVEKFPNFIIVVADCALQAYPTTLSLQVGQTWERGWGGREGGR